MKNLRAFLSAWPRRLRLMRTDERGVTAIEFAFIAPAMLALMAIAVFAGQGFEIDRKVSLTTRTLTDLVTQQTDVSSSSGAYTISQILKAAALVVAPYDSTQVNMVISELQVTGANTATVLWSQATGPGATALPTSTSVTVPSNVAATNGYIILGTAGYDYNPLQILFTTNPINFSDSLYMAPRNPGGIKCCASSGCC